MNTNTKRIEDRIIELSRSANVTPGKIEPKSKSEFEIMYFEQKNIRTGDVIEAFEMTRKKYNQLSFQDKELHKQILVKTDPFTGKYELHHKKYTEWYNKTKEAEIDITKKIEDKLMVARGTLSRIENIIDAINDDADDIRSNPDIPGIEIELLGMISGLSEDTVVKRLDEILGA